MFPNGNFGAFMKYSTKDIGELVKRLRAGLGVTQRRLALTSGTGLRFIIDLEKGKDTCQIGKVLTVLNTLGIKINLIDPGSNKPEWNPSKDGSQAAGERL
jgi:HTH-type transcriptional regulator/antitoxin HipB